MSIRKLDPIGGVAPIFHSRNPLPEVTSQEMRLAMLRMRRVMQEITLRTLRETLNGSTATTSIVRPKSALLPAKHFLLTPEAADLAAAAESRMDKTLEGRLKPLQEIAREEVAENIATLREHLEYFVDNCDHHLPQRACASLDAALSVCGRTLLLLKHQGMPPQEASQLLRDALDELLERAITLRMSALPTPEAKTRFADVAKGTFALFFTPDTAFARG